MPNQSHQLAEARARQALRAANLPFDGDLTRASSTNNEIHLSEGEVIRVAAIANVRLTRETSLYPYLPDTHWRPRLIVEGETGGYDYVILQRKPGQPVAHVWPFLPPHRRRAIITDLSGCLRSIHATPRPKSLAPLSTTLHALDETGILPHVTLPLESTLERIGADPNADPGIINAALDYLACNRMHLDHYDRRHLVHADLTFENFLFVGRALSAVIDFEWARGAPADFDLDVLLRCCHLPKAHVAGHLQAQTRRADYEDIPGWLAEDYPELFSRPHLRERLTIYSMAFDVKGASEMPIPARRSDFDDLHPYNRLTHLLAGGGHIADTLDRIGLPR